MEANNSENCAILASDIHGVSELRNSFFETLSNSSAKVNTVILNGDIFGTPTLSALEKYFDDIKQAYQEHLGATELLLQNLNSDLAKLGCTGFIGISQVDSHYDFAHFLSYVCSLYPQLRAIFEAEILADVRSFLDEVFRFAPNIQQVIINTGEFEAVTLRSLDPKDAPPEQQISSKIKAICQDYGRVVYNEQIMYLGDVAIIGAKALIAADPDQFTVRQTASCVICHFPTRADMLLEGCEPTLREVSFQNGLSAYLRLLRPDLFIYGHYHSPKHSTHHVESQGYMRINHEVGVGNHIIISFSL